MLLLLFVFSLLMGPVEYLTHEGAHYLVARAFGAHPMMHFDRIELPASTHLTPAQNLLFATAGPAADWAIGIIALVFLARRFNPLALVLAIWVARPLQFVHGLFGLGLTQLGISGDLAGTDEAVIAHALGVSARDIILMELILAIPLLLVIVYFMPAARRFRVVAVLTAGVLMGWGGWMAFAPYLLP